eukprot:m.33181 g.33181  ORF g.33181 m.33181 type:complete len:65 (-) comp7160_c0_seq2:141-335(-)
MRPSPVFPVCLDRESLLHSNTPRRSGCPLLLATDNTEREFDNLVGAATPLLTLVPDALLTTFGM